MLQARLNFLHTFCDICIQPRAHSGCGISFASILEPVRCPLEIIQTHQVCPFCLDVRPLATHHLDHCVFAQQQIQLRAGGWATATSSYVLHAFRLPNFRYREALINLLQTLLQEIYSENTVIVPMPMGAANRSDLWLKLTQDAAKRINNCKVIPALQRKKQRSTRKNVSQIREQIVNQEYFLDKELVSQIKHQRVILLDDNVTTGITMTQSAYLLKQFEPAEVIPLAIERTVSARLLQRCPAITDITCSHYINSDVNRSS